MDSLDSAGRRDELAVDRTVLAAERTYAAWVRTGLAALASGVGANSILAGTVPAWVSRLATTVLILCSVFCFVAGVWRELLAESTWPKSDVARIPPAILRITSGAMVVVAIAILLALWMRG